MVAPAKKNPSKRLKPSLNVRSKDAIRARRIGMASVFERGARPIVTAAPARAAAATSTCVGPLNSKLTLLVRVTATVRTRLCAALKKLLASVNRCGFVSLTVATTMENVDVDKAVLTQSVSRQCLVMSVVRPAQFAMW